MAKLLDAKQHLIEWSGIDGNDFPKYLLERFLVLDVIPHCVLFSGREGIGKYSIASLWAKVLLCDNNKDDYVPCGNCFGCRNVTVGGNKKIFIVDQESKILIDTIREIKDDLSRSDFDGGYRVVLVNNIDNLTNEAANAFLKILEEPARKTVFLLITNRLNKVKETIRSRAIVLHFNHLLPSEIDKSEETGWTSDELYRLSMGRPKILQKIVKNSKNKSIDNVENFWRMFYADVFKKADIAKQMSKMTNGNINNVLMFWESCLRDLQLYKIGSGENCWWNDERLFVLYDKIKIGVTRVELLLSEVAKLRNVLKSNASKKIQIFNLLICFNQ